MSRGRVAFILLLCASIAISCSVADTIGHPSCTGTGSSGLIAAQSVPTATLLPCLDPLPTGWEVDTVDVTQDGTTVVIDSDRAGGAAARLRFAPSCDIGAAISTPSDFAHTERFEAIHEITPRFRADRYYRFEGGCVWWHFDFDPDAPSAMSVELGNSLQLIDREWFNDGLRETFVDEDL